MNTELKKAFNDPKLMNVFIKQYKNGDIDFDCLINRVSNPFYELEKAEQRENIETFNGYNGIIHAVELMLNTFSKKFLEDKFGKYDFKINGNREYRNYIIEYDGLIFLGPQKWEVMLCEYADIERKSYEFLKLFYQSVFDHLIKNKMNDPSFAIEQKYLDAFIQKYTKDWEIQFPAFSSDMVLQKRSFVMDI